MFSATAPCFAARVAASAALAVLALAPAAHAQDTPDLSFHRHTVYIDANITGGNAVLAYDMHADGSLAALPGSPFATGGLGFYDSSFVLGPFDVDQEVAIKGNVLYAVNAGSNSISALNIGPDGGLSPVKGQPYASGGGTPVSLGLHGGTVVAVNSAQDPAQAGKGFVPNLTVSAVLPGGGLAIVPGFDTALPADAQPSQALTTNTGPFVFTAEFPGGGMLNAYYQHPNGKLTLTDSELLPMEPNDVQPLPLGMWANPKSPYLYVGFVNTGEVGVYTIGAGGKLQFVGKEPSSGIAVCWLRVDKGGRFLYSSNTGDNSMSVYDLSNPTTPIEIQHLLIGGMGGVQQFSLSPDQTFLYLLQEENSPASVGLSNMLYVMQVDGKTGMLTLLPQDTVKLPLPPNTRPFGVAVR
jgi:6-phosphogluconolactonase (cycloisomerase 2 family)